MRLVAFLALLVACAACGASGPAHPVVRVEVDATLRAEARAQARAETQAEAQGEIDGEASGEVRVEAPGEVRVEVPGDVRVEVPEDARVEAPDEGPAEAEVEVEVPAHPVPIEGAAVVEFFGIPLDDAEDVVFVLDRSGSMVESAQVRTARVEAPDSADAVDSADVAADDEGLPTAGTQDPDAPEADPVDADPPEAEMSDADITDADPDDGAPDADTAEDSAGLESPSASEPEEPAEPRAPPAPRKIDVAHAELVDALERLPAGTRMNIVFFNNRLEAVAAHLVPLEEERRDALVRFVLETEPDGRTALAPAMRAAYLMNARRIVLLSDGLGNLGGDAEAVLRDAREAMRGGVRIDAIGLGRDQDAQLLQALASESGGLYQGL